MHSINYSVARFTEFTLHDAIATNTTSTVAVYYISQLPCALTERKVYVDPAS